MTSRRRSPLRRCLVVGLVVVASDPPAGERPDARAADATPVVAKRRGVFAHSLPPLAEEEKALPRQAVVEAMAWKWDEARTTPEACAQALGDGSTLRVAPGPRRNSDRVITLSRAGRPDWVGEGHAHSVFVATEGVLYFADFSGSSTGCWIVAYDRETARPLWATALWGVECSMHSQYSNRIHLEIRGPDLVVYGHEGAGRYIELVDLKTGRTVGHQSLERVR